MKLRKLKGNTMNKKEEKNLKKSIEIENKQVLICNDKLNYIFYKIINIKNTTIYNLISFKFSKFKFLHFKKET